MNAATHHVLARALASHISKSILIGLPGAVIAIGAAGNIDLPDAIQQVVTRLDVTWWILPKGIPGEGTPAFVHWALPLNAVFYSFLAFLFLLWRSPLPSKAEPKPKKVENTTTPSPSNLDPNYSKVPALAEIVADVVSGRAKLEGAQWLLLSAPAHKVLADQLKALLPEGSFLGPRHLREVKFKPGRKLTAYYDAVISTEGSEAHRVRPIAVTWGSDTKADRPKETGDLVKMQAEAVCRGVAAPFLQLMADVPEWSLQIRVSPLDARFLQLVRVSDPRHVRAMLAQAYASAKAVGDQPRISEYTVTPVRYLPGRRHVLRYDPLDGTQGGTVFAKPYIGEDGARAFRLAQYAADWLAAHGQGVNCLRPLAFVAEDAVVLYPRVCGVPLSDYARRPDPLVARWLQQAGAALCTLHHLPAALADQLEPYDCAAEIRESAKKTDHIASLLPQAGSAIAALLDRARELHERLPQEPPTFTHGDFKSEHIWVAAGGFTVMDFDMARLADPALDVGQFLADWQFWQGAYDLAGIDQTYKSFLAGYAAAAPKERLLRARLYEAVALVKCAGRRVQLFESDWATRTGWLVDRAWSVLNELQRTFSSPARTLSTK